MSEKILDRDFVIYRDRNVFLGGQIQNGQLKLKSEVYGDKINPSCDMYCAVLLLLDYVSVQ